MVYSHLPYRQPGSALRKLSSFIPELIEVTDERTTDHETSIYSEILMLRMRF